MRRFVVVVGLLSLLALGLAGTALPCRAADSPKLRGSWLNPLRYRDLAYDQIARMKHIEAVEMVQAIVNGSQLGAGEGWFHPGESRYTWAWLAARCNTDKDGKIGRKEFPGGDALFERLDRNHDGVLTAGDFDWSERSPFARQTAMVEGWFDRIDADSNGRISKKEWLAFFENAAKDKNHLTPDDLRDALTPPPRPASKGGGGPTPLLLLKGLASGEIGSIHSGPKVGQRAPDFKLKTQDGKETISLSEFRGKKPVVLIFGSFT